MTETHDAAEQFQCIICLELVYKPIVHACGHLFCFWCVHRAMNGAYKNLCPLCRRPYMHFPRICEQLHFVLLKAVHDKYLIRAKEVLEEEAQGGVFSPELRPQPPRCRRQETPPEKASEEASSTDAETVSTSNVSSERGSVCLSNSSSSNGDNPSPSKETDQSSCLKLLYYENLRLFRLCWRIELRIYEKEFHFIFYFHPLKFYLEEVGKK